MIRFWSYPLLQVRLFKKYGIRNNKNHFVCPSIPTWSSYKNFVVKPNLQLTAGYIFVIGYLKVQGRDPHFQGKAVPQHSMTSLFVTIASYPTEHTSEMNLPLLIILRFVLHVSALAAGTDFQSTLLGGTHASKLIVTKVWHE